MFNKALPNARSLSCIDLRSKGINVENKLILGADYIFIVDSLCTTKIGNILPINIDGRPLRTNSQYMGYDFNENPNMGLYAIILHIANHIDCTIIHARITSSKNNTKRWKNEKRYVAEMGMTEIPFPYKNQSTAIEMMQSKNRYHAQNIVPNTITRHRLEDLIFDKDIFNPFDMEKHKDDNIFSYAADTPVQNTEFNEFGNETYEDFVEKISKDTNEKNETETIDDDAVTDKGTCTDTKISNDVTTENVSDTSSIE